MKQYNHLRNGILTGHGVHYNQDLSGGGTSSMNEKNNMVANMTTLFAKGSSQEAKFLGRPQTLRQETRPPHKSNLRHFLFYYSSSHLVHHTNHCLKQPKLLTNR
jgi:hypothetical protein